MEPLHVLVAGCSFKYGSQFLNDHLKWQPFQDDIQVELPFQTSPYFIVVVESRAAILRWPVNSCRHSKIKLQGLGANARWCLGLAMVVPTKMVPKF